MRLVYGSLLGKDGTGDVPWRERWSMDGNDYTFTLLQTPNSRTAPLTTADVAFTLDYYQEHLRCPTPGGGGRLSGGPLYGGG